MPNLEIQFLELFVKMLARRTGEISRVSFTPQKPAFSDLPIEQAFPRATPESQGISSEHVRNFLAELKASGEVDPHQVMLLRNGVVIAECAYAPYRRGVWHATNSLCKSITALAVGMLVAEGKLSLDEKLNDIFPRHVHPLQIFRSNQVTVRDLLRMSSAVDFAESGAVSGNDWVSGFMSAGIHGTPGEEFSYNSMNSYMLSVIVSERSGESLLSYITPRLLAPLGITEFFWETCPRGFQKGGWGAFIKPEDAAKLGQLCLQEGRWKNEQLVPASWIAEATSKQIDNSLYGYGYHFWMEERPGSYLMSGMFGQAVLVCPDIQLVLVVNAGNGEINPDGGMKRIIRKYFGSAFSPAEILAADAAAQERLSRDIAIFEGRQAVQATIRRGGWGSRRMEDLSHQQLAAQLPTGTRFAMDDANIGLYPLLLQLLHNNFTDGISEVSFSQERGGICMHVKEGTEEILLPAAFNGYAETDLRLHGESYRVATHARLTTDEDERLCLVLEICFLEEACRRYFHIHFGTDTIRVKAMERPGEGVVLSHISLISEIPVLRRVPFVGNLLDKGGAGLVEAVVRSAVRPDSMGHVIKEEKNDD